jgi:SAM-dependent methyltransferase
VAEDAERHRLRATFDTAAQQYDGARPGIPDHVFDDLVLRAGLVHGARLLEIGCGTGQATLPLAERGFAILAVELGASLADIARQKLAHYPGVEIVTSSFESWEPGGERFDAVVSFNAFHWLDPEIRFAKSASVLRPGGSLAVFGSTFVVHEAADPVWLSLAEEHEAVIGEPEPRRHLDDISDRRSEFVESGFVGGCTRDLYLWDRTYSSEDWVALLGTISMYRMLEDGVREELFRRIRGRIEHEGGVVSPTWCAVLYVARRG